MFNFHHHRHPRPAYVILWINRVGCVLEHEEELHYMTTVTVGHTIAMSIAYLDQNGNPMVTNPTPDPTPAPAWSNQNAAAESLVASADGLSAVATALAPGNDVVTLTLSVGGQSYSATLAVEVDPAPQVLTSIAIVPAVSKKK